jgi:hypothetical protein
MRTLITFLALISCNSFIIAQNLDEVRLKNTIDSLKNIIDVNNMKIDTLKAYNSRINIEIQKYTSEISANLIEDKIGDLFICKMSTILYDKPGVGGNSIISIKKGDKVKVFDKSNDNYYQVYFNDVTGFASKAAFITENEANQKKETPEQRKKYLTEKYGQTNGMKIWKGELWVGMTKVMVLEGLGSPKDTNKTTGQSGVHEQWIYNGNKYLYFENGVLTSWQD